MTQFCTVGPVALAVDLEKAKANLRIDGTDMDALVSGWVAGITGKLEHRIGQVLMEQTWHVVLDAFPSVSCWPRGSDLSIGLPHPVLGVTSVKYIDAAGAEQTLASTAYKLAPERYRTRLIPVRGTSWPATADESSAVTIELQCGYGSAPVATPPALQLYILAKLVEQFDPVAMTQRDLTADTVQAKFIEGLLDEFVTYA